MLCVVTTQSKSMFLFGSAYSVLLKPPLIVLLFFLLKVLHCSGVFGCNFFCDPVIRIFGQRWTGDSASCFPSFLSSFAERFLEIFDLVLGQVQKGCFLVVVASALTSISSMSKHLQVPTSNSNFQKQILLFNSDFRKQTPFSNSDFQKQTPLFKLPGRKQTPIFNKNKHRLFKSNSDVPLSFRILI